MKISGFNENADISIQIRIRDISFYTEMNSQGLP